MVKCDQNNLITCVREGKVVSFPTDTVPALAVLPGRSHLIFTLKDRPQNKPLILMGASSEDLWQYVTGTTAELEIWQQVAKNYWPGQLTLVLQTSRKLPAAINPTDPTSIGLRVPDCQIALEILAATGPLATTSANLSGEAPLETMTAIETTFPDVITLDFPQAGEKIGNGQPSTVAKWTENGWTILRQGNIQLVTDK